MSPSSCPVRVLHLREALVDFIYGHEFLLAATAVRARIDGLHGDGIDVFAAREGAVTCVVAEAVFYSYDDPVVR